jgi:hypothetical protein
MSGKIAKQILLAPVLGGLFVLFLPFIGFAIVIGYLSSSLWRFICNRGSHV